MLHTTQAHRVNGGYFLNKIGWPDPSTTLTLALEDTITIDKKSHLLQKNLQNSRHLKQQTQKALEKVRVHAENQSHLLRVEDQVFDTAMERSPHPEHRRPLVHRKPPYV